jgi:molybdopterin converting factor small subunit
VVSLSNHERWADVINLLYCSSFDKPVLSAFEGLRMNGINQGFLKSMKVLLPTPLLSYTKEREVKATGATLIELLADLDRQYPGLRFRVIDEQNMMRPHMRFFVNGDQVFSITQPLRPTDSVILVQALSGG